jgi:hypothetical protein
MADRPNLGGIDRREACQARRLRLRRAPETRGFCDEGGVTLTRQ